MKRVLLMFLATAVLVASVAAPVFAREDRQEDSSQTSRVSTQAECKTPGARCVPNGLFTAGFGPSTACEKLVTINWGDGTTSELTIPPYGGAEVPHQYAKPGLYTVVAPITEIPTQFSELCNPDDTYQDVVEFPANGECNVATASRSSVESSRKKLPEFKPPQECLPPKEDCVVSFFGAFCLVDKKLKDAYDKYKDLKEKYEEAKKIVDPKERKKALKEIAEEKNVAKEEYKKLLEDSKEQAKENAKKLNLPQEKMGKKINKALRGL